MTVDPARFGRLDDWLRWIVGGLVAGLIAYASVGARLATLETTVQAGTERAREDRKATKDAIEALTKQVNTLTIELKQEEQRRSDLTEGRRLDK